MIDLISDKPLRNCIQIKCMFEFIKWIKNDGTSKLSFKYISEKINEAN